MTANNRPKTPSLVTVGDIAREIGTDVNRVKYVLKDRLLVKPSQRFGPTDAYPSALIPKVRAELKRIAASRRPVKVKDDEAVKVG